MPQTDASVTGFATVMYFVVPIAIVIGLFTMLAVVGFARERRREREALYRHETARKLIDAGQMNYEQFAAFERAEAERPIVARRRALTVTGAVLVLAGLALYATLVEMPPDLQGVREMAVLAFLPIGIGFALLLYGLAAVAYAAVAARFAGKR